MAKNPHECLMFGSKMKVKEIVIKNVDEEIK